VHGHVLFVLENQPYPYDPRVRGQVAALVDAGYQVTVAGPTGAGYDSVAETGPGGVRVHRFRGAPPARHAAGYVREYLLSFVRLAGLVWRIDRRQRVDVMFVCSPPDFLMLLTLPFRPRAAVVFDDRELSPELFESKFGRRGLPYRLLLGAERWAFRLADTVVVTNESYAQNPSNRGGVDPSRVFVVGNGPDPARIFAVDPRPELRRGRAYLVLWMGAMSSQEGLERLLEAVDEVVHGRGRSDVAFSLVGPGDVHEALQSEIERRGLSDVVELPGRVGDDLVRAYMATADVCVAVDRPNAMNDRAAMRKVLEYMAMGRPVVQFPLAEMRRLCGDATVYADDAADLARRIHALLDDPDGRARLGEAARARLSEMRLSWPHQIPALLEAVEVATRLASERAGRSGSRPLLRLFGRARG
jgi:glycosyltransferase involved in cell wall biosynthesis